MPAASEPDARGRASPVAHALDLIRCPPHHPRVDRRRFLLTSLAGALGAPLAVGAQQAKKVRIGVLSTADGPEWEVFRQTLRALGYTEGRNLAFEYRWHGGKVDALPALAAELVSLKVDVIVTSAPNPTRATKAATSTIPIVFVSVADPISLGLVESLARPGGNVTGFQTLVLGDFGGKQLELLKTAVPSITRVAVLIVPANPLHRPFFDDLGPAAAALKLKLQLVEARAAEELERAFDAATRERADAVYVFGDPITFLHRRLVAELALRRRLPTMYLFKPNVEAGGLMSYGPSEPDMLRRAATSVDRILKGAKPGELRWSNRRCSSSSSTSRPPRPSASRSRRRCWRGPTRLSIHENGVPCQRCLHRWLFLALKAQLQRDPDGKRPPAIHSRTDNGA